MTVKKINEYLQTESYSQWEEGYVPNDLFENYDKCFRFRVSFIGREDIPWDDKDRKVHQGELGFAKHF